MLRYERDEVDWWAVPGAPGVVSKVLAAGHRLEAVAGLIQITAIVPPGGGYRYGTRYVIGDPATLAKPRLV